VILLSLNIIGVRGTLKGASFRRLLDRVRPEIIFIPETLVHEQKVRDFVNIFRPYWVSCAVNSLGSSGGLLVTWDPFIFLSKTTSYLWWYSVVWKIHFYIEATLFSKCLRSVLGQTCILG